jgi:hypothetical protein
MASLFQVLEVGVPVRQGLGRDHTPAAALIAYHRFCRQLEDKASAVESKELSKRGQSVRRRANPPQKPCQMPENRQMSAATDSSPKRQDFS